MRVFASCFADFSQREFDRGFVRQRESSTWCVVPESKLASKTQPLAIAEATYAKLRGEVNDALEVLAFHAGIIAELASKLQPSLVGLTLQNLLKNPFA
jgi:hypothetical protein